MMFPLQKWKSKIRQTIR